MFFTLNASRLLVNKHAFISFTPINKKAQALAVSLRFLKLPGTLAQQNQPYHYANSITNSSFGLRTFFWLTSQSLAASR